MLNEKQTNRNNEVPFLEVKSISFSYQPELTGNAINTGRTLTLKDVSFFVNKGERIAILGHNGSGKSTLVKILGGLIEVDKGECLVNGVNIQDMEFHELRGTIGMVFQDPENQIVAAMVEDDVAFAPENQGLPPNEIQERVDNALKRVNMSHKQDSSVAALSGGEKQRIALAGALAAKVDCLILDEAMSMLDTQGRKDIEKVLREIHAEGMTIIQVTHILEPESFSDIQRVIVLSQGEIVWHGTNKEFWDKAEDLGFDLPDKEITINHAPVISSNVKFKIDNLSFKYNPDDLNYALRNIDADIYAGQWLSIIGKTGSGKSTLVQHLNALYKIQEGNIYFDGQDLAQKGEEVHMLRQRVGLVFQHPEDQLFSPTVREELAFAPKNAGFRDSQLDEAILFGLKCVGLDKNFLERNPIALSGGERRLVAIASVLSAKPECVVLDEPLAGLDASYERIILTMLGRLRDEGKTIITITHDLRIALKFSDRILFLMDSKKVKEGTPDELINKLRTIYPDWFSDS